MIDIKGFIRIDALVNNAVGVISPIGELSTYGQTYSRERGEYVNSAYPGVSLISLSSVDTTAGSKVPVPAPMQTHILQVAKWLHTYAVGKGNIISASELHDDMLAYFSGHMSNLILGALRTNGTISLPSYVQWDEPTLASNSLKVWFADAEFRIQYSNHEIIVVPPITPLDDFFLSPAAVRTKVQARSISDAADIAQIAKNGHPETVLRTNTYDYKNSAAPSVTFGTNWTVLIYGAFGDNIDAIKDAIIAHILGNSSRTREQWTAILPDLFKRTEFNFLPRWDKVALPNMSVQEGVYSPIVNLKETIAFTKVMCPEFSGAHIDNNVMVLTSPFKSLALSCIANSDNLNNVFDLTEVFPDFINVGTASTDFNRMSANSRVFSETLNAMLAAAETITELTDPPFGMRKLKRGQTLYVAKVLGSIQYLVAAKSSANYDLPE